MMKYHLHLLIFVAAITVTGTDTERWFPGGGLSLDLAGDNASGKEILGGTNLLKNGDFLQVNGKTGLPLYWNGDFHLLLPLHTKEHIRSLSEKLRLPERCAMTLNVANQGNKLTMTIPDMGEYSPAMRGRLIQEVFLPPLTRETRFQLRFEYRGRNSDILGAVHSFDAPGNELKLLAPANKKLSTAETWQQRSFNFSVKPECTMLRIALRLMGDGVASFRNIRLFRELAAEEEVDFRLFPYAFLGETYHLAAEHFAQMVFLLNNRSADVRRDVSVTFELPGAVQLLAVNKPWRLLPEESRANFHTVTLENTSPGKFSQFFLIVRNNMPENQQAMLRYQYRDSRFQQDWQETPLRSIKAVKGSAAKIFQSGAVAGNIIDFDEAKMIEPWADYLAFSGFNAVNHGMINASANGVLKAPLSRNAAEYYHQRGISISTHSGSLSNAYRLHAGPPPQEILFRDEKGEAVTEKKYALLCPRAIYGEHAYVRNVLERHKNLLAQIGIDALEPNWEPFIFDTRGCFCKECKNEFALFAKLNEEQLSEIWPGKIWDHHSEQWAKFRSGQHARIISLVAREIGAGRFVPAIDAKEMNGINPNFYRLSSYRDYSGLLSKIVFWSPYVYHEMFSPFEYNTGSLRQVDDSARRIREELAHCKPPVPQTVAYPQAMQCFTWVTEPETLAFQYLVYFFNGWHGAYAYQFPSGYDARYWNRLAEVNNLIAGFENMVFDGEKVNRCQLEPESPMPDGDLLRIYEYAVPEQHLLAIANFWQLAEGFCRIRWSGLSEKKSYTVFDPVHQFFYANADGSAFFSAKDLHTRGVETQVGALSFRFLTVAEAGQKNCEPILTSEILTARKSSALGQIHAAMQWEKQHAERNQAASSQLESIQEGENSAVFKDGRITLTLPWGKAVIDTLHGGILQSFLDSGGELIHQKKSRGAMIDTFATLGRNGYSLSIDKPFQVTKMQFFRQDILLELSRLLTAEDNKLLENVEIRKKLLFHARHPQVDATVRLLNRGKKTRAGLLYMNKSFFAGLQINGTKKNAVVFSSPSSDIIFRRNFQQRIFRYANTGLPHLEKMVSTAPENIATSLADIVDDNGENRLGIEIKSSGKLYGWYFWDTFNAECATMEQVYLPVDLRAGESVDYVFSLTAGRTTVKKPDVP